MAMIPSREEIAKFRNPVRPAIMELVDLYEGFVAAEPDFGPVDLFVQPYLANYLPELIISTPRGVLVLEVFDGHAADDGAAARLKLVRDRAKLFRNAFRELCFPPINELCAKLGLQHPGIAALDIVKSSIDAAVIGLACTTEELRGLDKNRNQIPVYGRPDSAGFAPWPATGGASRVPEQQRAQVLARFREVARSWLTPTFHRAEHGRVGQDQLTRAQRPHAMPRGPGWFRLQGPAGSGKSMLLAHKAAVLASQGKDVLIACFNITLRNYLHELVSQMRYDFDWRHITIRHVHELFKEVRLHFLAPVPGDPESDTNDFLDRVYPELAERLLSSNPHHRFRYDAVLVDEGQDFSAAFFRVLAACLAEDGELLLVRDPDQNLYDKDAKWCDSGGPSIRVGGGLKGFSGPWAKLPTTWRMSPEITRAVSEFAVRELNSERFSTDEQRQPTFFDAASFCRWDNSSPDRVVARTVEVVVEVSQKMTPTHPSDLAVLACTNKRAWEVVEALRKAGLPAVHVYDSDGLKTRDKMFEFCRGDGRIKVCTGHSFKGFEVWGVIVLAETVRGKSQPHWLYTAMGRAIEGLWVLNTDRRLDHVIEWFPQS